MNWKKHFQRCSFGTSDFGADFGVESPDTIKLAQSKLNSLGYGPLVVDGSAGPLTQAATRRFQSDHNLTMDGVIGPQTLAALGIVAPKSTLKSVSLPGIVGVKQSVVNVYPDFTQKFEGYTPYMYTDSKGNVTTGIGNLIDPIGMALSLPWKRPDGSLAGQSEIIDAWNTIKNAYPSVQSTASASLTNLRLDAQAIGNLVHQKMAQNHQILRNQYPNIDDLPADAQLALHSIAWPWGAAFANVWGSNGQEFKAAIANMDFVSAANLMSQASQHEESINPGIIPRDQANRQLFANAADVIAKRGNYNTLFYPNAVTIAIFSLATIAWLVFGVFVFVFLEKEKIVLRSLVP